MQHDVFVNPGARTRSTQPFLTVLQADIAEGPGRLVCAIFAPHASLAYSKTVLALEIGGGSYVLPLEQLTGFPARLLRRPIASLASYRDDIIRGLIWLFTGI